MREHLARPLTEVLEHLLADEEVSPRRRKVTNAQSAANRRAGVKWCRGCEGAKPLAAFGGNTSRSDGLNSQCRECDAAYHSAWTEANRERVKEHAAKHRAVNRESIRGKVAAWQAAHPDRQRQSEISYRARNPEKRKASCAAYRAANKEKEATYRAAYAARNKDRLAEKAAGRRARKLQATPAWADKTAMRAVYAEAQRLTVATGVPHHVDHVVPLKSEWVCGLHCPANLEICTGGENMSKGNRAWPGMF